MSCSTLTDIDVQITCLKEALSISNGLKEQIELLQSEKKELFEKCNDLAAQVESLKNKKCANCDLLSNQLNKERKEKAAYKKEQKAKLLRAIAKSLESVDEVNTNQITNAQLLTELVCAGLNDSNESKGQRSVQLLNDSETCDDESNSKILVNETIVEVESEESSSDCNLRVEPFVVPETEPTADAALEPVIKNQLYHAKEHLLNSKISGGLEEKRIQVEEDETQPHIKRLRSSAKSSWTSVNYEDQPKPQLLTCVQEVDSNKKLVNNLDRSQSVLSEIIDSIEDNKSGRLNEIIIAQEEKGILWKMKPSVILDSKSACGKGKKLKQMTLSLSRPEKIHDISLSENFKGGVANPAARQSDDEKDVILPSPERFTKRTFSRKQESCDTMEDPDLTVFQPGITSTCLPGPVNNSFDRLPQPFNSPPFKYRRDVVRKREERQKLPGQECDQCAKYYEAAGVKPDDRQAWMNACSRHRDKYQIRAQTPPGFWDPVLPPSPEENLHKKT